MPVVLPSPNREWKKPHDGLGPGKYGSRGEDGVRLQEGLSVGAIWAVYQISKTMGTERVLGANFAGRLAMWQVIAQVIEQGSRLSAVRLAQTHAACYANLLIVGKH